MLILSMKDVFFILFEHISFSESVVVFFIPHGGIVFFIQEEAQ